MPTRHDDLFNDLPIGYRRLKMMKILCVAEKPSIAKAVSQILSGGRLDTTGTNTTFIKNYKFSSRFPDWGECDVVFTSVAGHLTEYDFDVQWRKWTQCAPVALFEEARIIETVPNVYPIVKGVDDLGIEGDL